MTLLLREVGRFVLEAGLWSITLVAVAGLAAAAVLVPPTRRLDRRDLGLAVVAGGILAAFAHRIGIGLVWAPSVGGRVLPVVWAVIGSAATAAFLHLRRRRTGP